MWTYKDFIATCAKLRELELVCACSIAVKMNYGHFAMPSPIWYAVSRDVCSHDNDNEANQ